jgi:NTE family protein
MDIMGNRLDSAQLPAADLVIAPKLGKIGVMDFGMAEECIEIGRKAAEEAIPYINELIEKHLAERNRVS